MEAKTREMSKMPSVRCEEMNTELNALRQARDQLRVECSELQTKASDDLSDDESRRYSTRCTTSTSSLSITPPPLEWCCRRSLSGSPCVHPWSYPVSLLTWYLINYLQELQTKFTTSVHQGTTMNWLDFDIKTSNVKVTVRPHTVNKHFGRYFHTFFSRMHPHLSLKPITFTHCKVHMTFAVK